MGTTGLFSSRYCPQRDQPYTEFTQYYALYSASHIYNVDKSRYFIFKVTAFIYHTV